MTMYLYTMIGSTVLTYCELYVYEYSYRDDALYLLCEVALCYLMRNVTYEYQYSILRVLSDLLYRGLQPYSILPCSYMYSRNPTVSYRTVPYSRIAAWTSRTERVFSMRVVRRLPSMPATSCHSMPSAEGDDESKIRRMV